METFHILLVVQVIKWLFGYIKILNAYFQNTCILSQEDICVFTEVLTWKQIKRSSIEKGLYKPWYIK